MNIITSKDNETIKHIKKLKDKKYRDQNNEFIVEGIKIIKEAIEEKAIIKAIIVCDECVSEGQIPQKWLYEIAKYNLIYVSEKIFTTLTDVVSPQGILAVIEKKDTSKVNYEEDIIVCLDNIQDPGNMGTILRTIDSVGLKQVVISKSSVDAFNPKVVRSTMGAIYRVNIIEVDSLEQFIKEAKKNKYKVSATCLDNAISIYDMSYENKVIVIGNEANGVSKEVLEICDECVKIPMIRENRVFKCLSCNWSCIV